MCHMQHKPYIKMFIQKYRLSIVLVCVGYILFDKITIW